MKYKVPAIAACPLASRSVPPRAVPAALGQLSVEHSVLVRRVRHAHPSAQTASKPFGPACSAVPSSGAGSFTGMSTAPVATAASNNPVLSTLVTAVKKADLVDTLNSANDITVFAPENSAFAEIPSATLTKVLANKAELTKILTYHVVGGNVSPPTSPRAARRRPWRAPR